MSGDPLVDWELAERLAVAVAGSAEVESGAGRPFGPVAVEAACERASQSVAAYTGFTAHGAPAGEAVNRGEWARTALVTMREVVGGIEARMADGLTLPGPLGAIVRAVAGRAVGAEAGAVVGLAARRVLGQYEVSLTGSDRAPRLLLVEPNLLATHRELGGEEATFLHWIALHETTHALQFGSVEWLRSHLAGLLDELIQAGFMGLDRSRLAELARRLVSSDPRRTVRALLRGEMARLLAGPEQAAVFDRLQAAMSVIEGYAEHVMDRAAPEHARELALLRHRIDERRSDRGGLGDAVARLLGLEMKLRQYRLGKAFCDEVVAEGGIETLNLVWSEPQALPTAAELEAPAAWLARMRALAAA